MLARTVLLLCILLSPSPQRAASRSDTQRRQEEKTATQDTPTPQADQTTNKDGSEKRKRTQRRTHFRARVSAFFSCSRCTSAFARVRLHSFASVRLHPHPCVYVRVLASTFASVHLRPHPCVRVRSRAYN